MALMMEDLRRMYAIQMQVKIDGLLVAYKIVSDKQGDVVAALNLILELVRSCERIRDGKYGEAD